MQEAKKIDTGQRLLIILPLIALFAVMLTAASPGLPKFLGDALNRVRPGIGKFAMRLILDANTTTGTFPARSGGTVPMCFADQGTLVIVALNEATCCVDQAYNSTIGDQTTDAATTINDPDGSGDTYDGPGNCRTMPAGGEWHQTIDTYEQSSNFGGRWSVCSAYVDPGNRARGLLVRPPCRVGTDADCTAAGAPAGTTCLTNPTADQRSESCVFAHCRAVNASTDVTASFEK